MGEEMREEIREEKRFNGYYNYTVVLTYIGMLTGFAGILFVMEARYCQAVMSLMIAGICDMFDGTIAATKQRDCREKRFGVQIDSLSDLICFGVLPALITYGITGKSYAGFFTGGLYVLCTLIRLAYFNVMEEERQNTEGGRRTCYQGLPVTTAALILPVFYVIGNKMHHGANVLLQGVHVLMSVAFISTFKVNKPHLAGKIGIIVVGIAEFVILFMGLGLKV